MKPPGFADHEKVAPFEYVELVASITSATVMQFKMSGGMTFGTGGTLSCATVTWSVAVQPEAVFVTSKM